MISNAITIAYALILVLLLLFACSGFHLAVIHRKLRLNPPPVPAPLDDRDLPFVTVQLPLYNERHVAKRLIDYVAALDYPRDRFEVHVLDDSTDDTPAIVAAALAPLITAGFNIAHIRRAVREGYKAGARRDGLSQARGEFIAIFDADFCPAPDMLRKALPYFRDPRIGIVQLRWAFLNVAYSGLTRMQSFMFAGHFGMEQLARSAGHLFSNFNGTAGLWRRSTIDDAGGWHADTLTEDLDLSYRAQLKGWRVAYLEHETCDSELPVDMGGFRSQQYRWMKGGAENARLHLWRVLRSDQPARVKWHAGTHLLGSSAYILTLGLSLCCIAMGFLDHPLFDRMALWFQAIYAFNLTVLTFAYLEAVHPRDGSGLWRFTVGLAGFMIFNLAICLHNGLAAISGWLGRRSEFVRTPKFGVVGQHGNWAAMAYATRAIAPINWAELALLLLTGASLASGWVRRDFAFYPVTLLIFAGLAWTVGLSLSHSLLARLSLPPRLARGRVEVP